MPTRTLVLVTLLALTTRVDGQFTPGQAIKQAKAGTKQVLADYKVRTGEALVGLQAALDALVAGLKADQFGAPLLQTFLDSAHAFQLEVADATEDADVAIATAFGVALAGVAEAQGPLAQGFPPGFVSGDKGAFDDAVARLARVAGTFYAKLEKRSAVAIAEARAAGVGLTLQFFRPVRRGFFGPLEDDTVGSFHNPVKAHFIAGASRLGVEHDGILLLSGTAVFVGGDVNVQLFSTGAEGEAIVVQESTTPASFAGLGGEWSLLVDDDGAGLAERNYGFDAFFSGDFTSADGCAGVP